MAPFFRTGVHTVHTWCAIKVAPKEFANFFNNHGELLHKNYTLVTHLTFCKSGKFYYIMCIIDKTALLLIVATWRFDVIKNCLALIAFKTSANTISVDTFLSYSKCSECLPLDFMYSLNLFLKLGTALFCRKFSHVFSSATFNSETVFGFV